MLPFALVKFLGQERRCRERLSSTLPRDDEAREFPCPGGGRELHDEVQHGLDSGCCWEELQSDRLVPHVFF